jgi:hypothetical protein
MGRRDALIWALAVSIVGGVGIGLAASSSASRASREQAIRQAQVWLPATVSSQNLKSGPGGPLAFKPGETVTCDFVPKPHGKGSTLKFDCKLPSGRNLKVRYGAGNGEVYAQVAATRLLWALGFPANRMYPVRVVCRGCPANPFKDPAPATRTAPVVFDPATIDEKADGKTIETKPDEGWSWRELEDVDESRGGAPRSQRDALKLLAAFIQHSSNKAINQRIVCLDAPRCSQTVMMIADLGKTFGRANALNNDDTGAMNFSEWAPLPIWKDSKIGCVANLPASWSGTLHDPRISDAGRAFLAERLNQLSDTQLHDLFDVARVTTRDPHTSIDDWVAAFKRKRAEIANRRCD